MTTRVLLLGFWVFLVQQLVIDADISRKKVR